MMRVMRVVSYLHTGLLIKCYMFIPTIDMMMMMMDNGSNE